MKASAPLLAVALAALAVPVQASGACPALRWTTLGTAGGPVPTMDRSEPANLLTVGDRLVLVDTGDGTVTQLARMGLEVGAVREVFISHHHHDHTGGLAAVIGLRWMNNFPGELIVYGPPGTREMVNGIVASLQPQARVGFGLGSSDRSPESSIRVVEINGGETLTVGAMTVTAAANTHFDHDGPQPEDAPQSLSYRFTLAGRSITYTGDTGPSAAVANLAAGSDMLVSEVIDLDGLLAAIRVRRGDMPAQVMADMAKHLSTHHLPPADVGAIAAKAGVGHLVLTHFAVPPGPLVQAEAALRSGVAQHYAGPVDLARDLSSYDVGCK